ncbi:YbaL family putative K(+) efflux transporter [Sphingomonas crocodyli]|uniref:Kef family K(+) transporter n=1 Tax=Sphingomonas crocodyli TaxID=1979270 RepID=A0A437M0T8_9SPHN|nr:YbaL family putative K(+) efflux transporter [Sphingomonas crocodyli]RVT91268.1 Kef family K(+) transporter [Sphingomonas crocodyli]
MPHHTPLVATIVAGLVVAFIFGALAHRMRISPIAGYLLAGVAVGPFTPGFVAHSGLANELAEIGVILLMFGVGLHFSLRDLLSVKKIAVPGAIGQIAAATLMGMGLGWLFGWTPVAGFVFGLALSVASTVVLLRAMQSLDLVDTERGRIAVGWLIVEDLVMVLALVLLPVLARSTSGEGASGTTEIAMALGGTLLKVGGFLALILIVGRRFIPSTLHWVAHSGSRELFRLAVLAIALGVAFGAAVVFGVSFALGAFFAGMILGETELSRRATEETLPLRDAFAVLFFVSVGMLFNPSIVVEQPLGVLATVGIIVVGKSIAAYAIVRAFGHSSHKAITIAASLAQIGEFSFILITLGANLEILPADARDMVLAGAMISIFLNPIIFSFVPRREAEDAEPEAETEQKPARKGHWILVGYGRVGRQLASDISEKARSFVIIEGEKDMAERARKSGYEVVTGNAVEQKTLRAAGADHASVILIAIPEGFEAGAVLEQARAICPNIRVIARSHSDAEYEHLEKLGADCVISGEREIARRMAELCVG